ncbi:hypothetical protein [Nocardia sp. NPDC003963]
MTVTGTEVTARADDLGAAGPHGGEHSAIEELREPPDDRSNTPVFFELLSALFVFTTLPRAIPGPTQCMLTPEFGISSVT